jgi:hypothetical protein
MTTRARQVLVDCEPALADFEAGANTPYQRTRWVALMTLLRTVGLVLKSVDHEVGNAQMRRAIDDHWNRLNAMKPEPRIFHDFIDAERYQAVHLYEIRAGVNITIRPGSGSLRIGTPEWFSIVMDEDDTVGGRPTVVDFTMRLGPFEGRDPRELCREAIVFWKEYLDVIDRDAAR